LLASLEEKSTCRELGCFLRVGDRNDLKKNILVDETVEDGFALFWKAMAGLEIEVFSYF